MADDTPDAPPIEPHHSETVQLRDGVALAADIYLPEAVEGPLPTLLRRTPYNKRGEYFLKEAAAFTAGGYAVVVQDVRGKFASEGEWAPFFGEGPDGFDTIEWVAEQPWCDGRVATYGGSYSGWTQWVAARERPPHLVAIASTSSGGNWLQEVPWDHGILGVPVVMWLAATAGQTENDPTGIDWEKVFTHLPLSTIEEAVGSEVPLWREWLDHPTLDDYWRPHRFTPEDFASIDLPALHLAGYYDADQPGALFFYRGMVGHSPARDRQTIRLGPWEHGEIGERQELGGVDFGPGCLLDVFDLHVRWFDSVFGDGRPTESRCDYYLTGANAWRHTPAWPPTTESLTQYHLRSGGAANTLDGDGTLGGPPPAGEPADEYLYDPEDPVVTWPAVNPFTDPEAEPSYDYRFLADRKDVLAYTTEPLDAAVTVAGHPEVILYASSDGPDTDWFVSLHDVDAEGRPTRLSQGRLRARFRESLERETPLVPGEVHEFRLTLSATAHRFAAGHRIRLLVTSSDFPMYDRNPNTGHPIGQDAEVRVALNRVHHEAGHPSRLVLPVANEEDGA